MEPKPEADLSLAAFIDGNEEAIFKRWERFARGIPAARHLDHSALRDHAAGMLATIAADLRAAQTPLEQSEKSKGRAPRLVGSTQAELHGAERVGLGFSVNDAIAEFRALRASVLQLWGEANKAALSSAGEKLTRFNEAVDQALADSVARFAIEKDEYTRRLDTLLSSSPDLHYIVGVDGRLLYANHALSNLLGIPQHLVPGRNIDDLCPELVPRFRRDLRQVTETGEPLRAEMRRPGSDGAEVTYRYVFLPVLGDDGRVDSVSGTARNISEIKAYEEKIHRNAYYDSLTGLPNRALFQDRLEQNVKHAARTGHALALIFIDLDGFKEVNDRSGHAAGDELLKECARRIGGCVRGTDTVARIGGDEFTVILSEVNDILHVEILAKSILDELAKPFVIGAASYYV
ncbi:sensor domain-containing diguanylate cyclase [Massilia glaciei]|uniref:Sensor domain-containing diguanylate cyclase n=1 Tax=Massilia glaciei TaxID=1524097 RepID=A0A2U2I6E6_9BURK|nr:sensor domain-containing diguanylate cyclase [Massilia glaciei]